MPELPEVETTRLGLSPILGACITDVAILNPSLRQPVDADLDEKLLGARMDALTRRSKYLIIGVTGGHLIVHLGMSGSLRLTAPDAPLRKHDHIRIDLDNGFSLRFHDPRRFGLFLWTDAPWKDHPLMRALGPEPLEPHFTAEGLYRASRSRKSPVKAFLMDNSVVVGVGNIYASETLFRCGIHPLMPACRLTPDDCLRLHAVIRVILTAAIARGGTTLRDFVNGRGNPGYFQQELAVYGREGEPCVTCATSLECVKIGGRSSIFCPICQPLNPERLA